MRPQGEGAAIPRDHTASRAILPLPLCTQGLGIWGKGEGKEMEEGGGSSGKSQPWLSLFDWIRAKPPGWHFCLSASVGLGDRSCWVTHCQPSHLAFCKNMAPEWLLSSYTYCFEHIRYFNILRPQEQMELECGFFLWRCPISSGEWPANPHVGDQVLC